MICAWTGFCGICFLNLAKRGVLSEGKALGGGDKAQIRTRPRVGHKREVNPSGAVRSPKPSLGKPNPKQNTEQSAGSAAPLSPTPPGGRPRAAGAARSGLPRRAGPGRGGGGCAGAERGPAAGSGAGAEARRRRSGGGLRGHAGRVGAAAGAGRPVRLLRVPAAARHRVGLVEADAAGRHLPSRAADGEAGGRRPTLGMAPLVVVVVGGAPRAGSPPAGGLLRGLWG